MIQMGRLNERAKATGQQNNFFRGKAGEQPVVEVGRDFWCNKYDEISGEPWLLATVRSIAP